MMSVDLIYYITIMKIKGADYQCIISRINKSKAINLLEKAYLREKSGTL